MFKKPHLKLTLNKTHFLPNDTIDGTLTIKVNSNLDFEDIQLKARCDETALIHTDATSMKYEFSIGFRQPHFGTRKVQERVLNNQSGQYEATFRHFELITTIHRKSTLTPGSHDFKFSILLPKEKTLKCPPQCAIDNNVGVFWTLKAVVHRQNLKSNLRVEASIPVYPPQNLNKTYNSVTIKGSTFGCTSVPQPPEQLMAKEPIKLRLVQVCTARIKALESTYKKTIELHNYKLKHLVPPPFKGEYLSVQYKMEVEVEGETGQFDTVVDDVV